MNITLSGVVSVAEKQAADERRRLREHWGEEVRVWVVSLQLKEICVGVTGGFGGVGLGRGMRQEAQLKNTRAVQHCECRTGEADGRAGGVAEYKRDEKEGRVNWP